MTREEKTIVTLTSFGHALTHSYLLVYPAVLLLLQKEFSLGFLGLGLVGGLATLAYGVGALPGGVLCDWLGPRRLLLVCFLGSALTSLMIALSSSFSLFAVGITLLGFFGSVYHPMANVLLTSRVKEMGKAIGIHGAAGNIGLALTPSIAAVIASRWGWRTVYLLAVLPGLFISLGAFFVNMSLPQKDPRLTPQPRSLSRIGLLCAVPLLLIYCINGLNGFCNLGVMTFLPAYIAEKARFPLFSMSNMVIGGTLSSIVLFLGLFGQYAGGMRTQGRHHERSILVAAAMSLPLVLAMSITDNVILLLAACGYFFLNFAIQPMTNVALALYAPLGMRGTAFGVFFSTGFGVAALAPAFAGYLAEQFGMSALFFGMAAGVLLMVFSAIFLVRYAPGRMNRSKTKATVLPKSR